RHPPTPDTYTLSLHDALPICRGDFPLHNVAAEPIQNRYQIHKSTPQSDVCNIRAPDLIGSRDCQTAQQVRIDPMTWRRIRQPRRSEEHTSELQSLRHLVCRLL